MLCTRALTDALEKVAIVVEALLTVALVAWHRVLTATLLTDLLGKQRALVNICKEQTKGQTAVVSMS